ncbi:MAG: hypothetical protein D6706_12905, partial [Chloroflexi bacterium]
MMAILRILPLLTGVRGRIALGLISLVLVLGGGWYYIETWKKQIQEEAINSVKTQVLQETLDMKREIDQAIRE